VNEMSMKLQPENLSVIGKGDGGVEMKYYNEYWRNRMWNGCAS